MLEQTSSNLASLQTQFNQPADNTNRGLNKIVAIGYGQNKSQCLPTSRYSLKVSLLGLSNLGVTSSIGLAALGHKVLAVDHDQRKVNALNQGRVSSNDVKLKPLLKQVRRLNNLVASCDLHHSVLNTDLSLVCTEDCNLKATSNSMEKMTSIIGQVSATLSSKRDFHLIVICHAAIDTETQNLMGKDIELRTGKTLSKDFGLCFLPIKLRDDQALSDFYSLPNIKIDVSDRKSEELIDKLLDGFKGKPKYFRYSRVLNRASIY